MAELGLKYTAADYAGAITVLASRRPRRGTLLPAARHPADADHVLAAWPLGVLSLSEQGFRRLSRRRQPARSGFTSLFNAAGNPAMSVACLHWSASGLPIGIQFVAPFGDEARLFRLPPNSSRPSVEGTKRPKLAWWY